MSATDHQLIDFPPLIFPSELVQSCRELDKTELKVAGFEFAGDYAGIKKKSSRFDLGLIIAPQGALCAGVYTQNQVVAAPVILSRQHLAQSKTVKAVIVNSGNANACTGTQGMHHAQEVTTAVMNTLLERGMFLEESQIQIASTGVIGAPLPVQKITQALPQLFQHRSVDGLERFACSIMTTDNRPKFRGIKVKLSGLDGANGCEELTIIGCSKGAGMIHPNMATMLGYLCTDAVLCPENTQALWSNICDQSFNAISIDGDTSTNDTALLLSSGRSGTRALEGEALAFFTQATQVLARALAVDILRDGEGVEHIAHITVKGARNVIEARQVAQTIALSPLVKTALNGCDPNWGRIVAAVGRSGVSVNPEKISLSIADAQIYQDGQWQGLEAEQKAHQAMLGAEYPIRIDLGLGLSEFTLSSTDLSEQYVRINADYRS